MSINALVLGTLLTQPTQRTAKSGNAYTVCRLKVAGAGTGDAGADTLLVNCIAFSETAQAALLALDAGEGIAVSGQLRAGNDQGDRQRDQRPTHDAWRAGAPAGRQQHRAPADDLDDDLSDVF